MSDVILNPKSISNSLTYSEDTSLKYFLSDSKFNENQELTISLEEGVSLDLVMIDFSKSDINLNLTVNLKANSRVNLSLASINSLSFNKIYNFSVNHNDVDSYSRVKMFGINASSAKLVFLGNSTIVNGAKRSDTRQEGRITNLSKDSKSEASPALIIKENDVKASHGAALGAYNPDQIFYLMSRGLSLEESKKLITYGTLLPVIEMLKDDKLIYQAKEYLEGLSL